MFTSQIYVSVTAELPVSGGWWIYIMSNSQSLPSPSVSFHIKHSSLCWIPRMVAIWLCSNYSWILGPVSLLCRMVSCLWPGGSQYGHLLTATSAPSPAVTISPFFILRHLPFRNSCLYYSFLSVPHWSITYSVQQNPCHWFLWIFWL